MLPPGFPIAQVRPASLPALLLAARCTRRPLGLLESGYGLNASGEEDLACLIIAKQRQRRALIAEWELRKPVCQVMFCYAVNTKT